MGKPSWYVTNHPGQLSLAIPPWVGAMNTSERWDEILLLQCESMSSWGLKNIDQCHHMGLTAREGLHFTLLYIAIPAVLWCCSCNKKQGHLAFKNLLQKFSMVTQPNWNKSVKSISVEQKKRNNNEWPLSSLEVYNHIMAVLQQLYRGFNKTKCPSLTGRVPKLWERICPQTERPLCCPTNGLKLIKNVAILMHCHIQHFQLKYLKC